MIYASKPPPFFDILVHDIENSPGLTTAIAGYESNNWRNAAMAEHLMEWIPEFALQYSELADNSPGIIRRRLKQAASKVYKTRNTSNRGEIGEILLHALIRQLFNSEPAISKIFFKSSNNDTVKGFDAIHIVDVDAKLELWLGESKFYTDYKRAVTDVVKELKDHLGNDYLRQEFMLVTGKIDPQWKYCERVKKLLDQNTTLDTIFECMRIPILLTYESVAAANHQRVTEEFKQEMKKELEANYAHFSSRTLPPIKIHLFLVPLHKKEHLIDEFDKKLEGQQR